MSKRLSWVIACAVAGWVAVLFALLSGCAASPDANPAALGGATRIPRSTSTPAPTATATRPSNLPSGAVQVDVSDNFFQPGVITVTVGTTVRWYRSGARTHNVWSMDGSWGVSELGAGGYAEHRFDRPGEYEYMCSIHAPSMRGIIVVTPK